MSHKQFAIDQVDVCFDTAESAIECIEKRTLMQIVVVRMGLATDICFLTT